MKKAFILALCTFISYYSFAQLPLLSIKDLTDSIQQIVRREHIPGLMLGITRKDSILFSGGFGYANKEERIPVTTRTLFRMGSVTKSLMAIGILQLVENGKITLDDEIRKIASEVNFKNRWENTDPLRVINLLEHTTGFDDMKFDNMYSIDKKEYNTEEMMRLQQNSMVCRWRPGQRHSYSNINYTILAYLIKKITGMEYDAYLAKNVLLPLKMQSSNFNRWSKLPGLDACEYVVPHGNVKKIPSVSVLIGPAMSLWSCSNDMIKLVQMFLRKGSPVLSENSVSQMEIPHSSLAARAGLKCGYAMGNDGFRLYNKFPFRGHEGFAGACNSIYMYNRKLDLGFVMASNCNGQDKTIENLITGFFEKNLTAARLKTIPLDTTGILPFLGFYQFESPRYANLAFMDKLTQFGEIRIAKDTLYFNFLGRERMLLPTGPMTFAYQGANTPTVIFTRDDQGKRILVMDDDYYEQRTGIAIFGGRSLLLLALILAFISFPVSIALLVRALIKKPVSANWLIMILPPLSISLLIWGLANFFKVDEEPYLLYQLRTVSARSLVIFLAPLLAGILSVIYFIRVLMIRQKGKATFYGLYCLAIAFSLLLITGFLGINGWIGLRTWSL